MGWSRSVLSSMVSDIAWEATNEDETVGEMIVTWRKGRRSIYSGVPEDVADQAARAPSVGQFMNTAVKPFYDHRYG